MRLAFLVYRDRSLLLPAKQSEHLGFCKCGRSGFQWPDSAVALNLHSDVHPAADGVYCKSNERLQLLRRGGRAQKNLQPPKHGFRLNAVILFARAGLRDVAKKRQLAFDDLVTSRIDGANRPRRTAVR